MRVYNIRAPCDVASACVRAPPPPPLPWAHAEVVAVQYLASLPPPPHVYIVITAAAEKRVRLADGQVPCVCFYQPPGGVGGGPGR